MLKEEISIPGGTVSLNDLASDHVSKEDPYVSGLLLSEKWFWKRQILEDLEKVPTWIRKLAEVGA